MLTPTRHDWVYRLGAWTISPARFWSEEEDERTALARNGFWPSGNRIIGTQFSVFEGTLYVKNLNSESEFLFLVIMDMGGLMFNIFIPDLPSLWMFCREAKDIAELDERRNLVEDAEEKKAEENERLTRQSRPRAPRDA